MGIVYTFIFFIVGVIIIVKGGDWFLDASIWIAGRTGVSLVIIGATIISLATTLPELFVSVIASKEGLSDMAIGNSIGSVICNIAFIVGICTLIKPIKIKRKYFSLKGIMLVSYLFLFFILSLDGVITKLEGSLLILLSSGFLAFNLLENKKTSYPNSRKNNNILKSEELFLNSIKFLLGAIFIISGANLLVSTGVDIAIYFKIPRQVVSLTLLALGTSLPELVTSISAILKNKQDITIGNILGACILNLTIVIGVSSLVSYGGLSVPKETLVLDIPMAVLSALIFILPGVIRGKLGRFAGFSLLSIYLLYLMKLI